MISSIKLKNVATYSVEKEEILDSKKINFIYGNNGTGKTTISRLIENSTNPVYKDCTIEWDSEIKCESLIYNQDFVKSNFNSETQLRGIYTFGEESEEIYKQIEKYTEEKNNLNKELILNEEKINRKKQEIINLKKSTSEILWTNYRKKYCDQFPELFKGKVGTKDIFFDNCIKSIYKEEILSFDKIKEEYLLLYKENQSEKSLINNFNFIQFNELISSKIFFTEIIENEDVNLARLIQDLNNSYWVEEGLKFLEKSNNLCPFCQKSLGADFVKSLYNLYDGKYKQDKKEFVDAMNILKTKITEIRELINAHAEKILNTELVVKVENYFHRIEEELNIKFDNLKYVCDFPKENIELNELYETINDINETIKENNNKIKNIAQSRANLIEKAWNSLRNICNSEVQSYLNNNSNLEKELTDLQNELENMKSTLKSLEGKIKESENSITSITKTIHNINDILEKFNYKNFKLIENSDHLTYSIIRPNGDDASKTLSEGEASFISFLYFYNLVFGSRTRSGLQKNHILVIDDPVTSMDSNTLFIISTLVRNLIDLCLDNKRNINQIFILSHNLYFFKEVSYGYGGQGKQKNKISYFVVQKNNGSSRIKNYNNENPIKNSYELLWDRLREKDYNDDSNLNTMRRILEQFLKLLGFGGPNNKNTWLINRFDDKDKILVKSLLSYINDGSHSIMDGLYIAPDENANENAFRVFKRIFIELDQENHYNMMMNEEKEAIDLDSKNNYNKSSLKENVKKELVTN